MKAVLFAAGVVAAVLSAGAEDAAAKVAFTGAPATTVAELTDDMLLLKENWSNGLDVDPTKEYELNRAGTFSIGGGLTFNGKSLTFSQGFLVMSKESTSFTFANDGLILKGGRLNATSTTGLGHTNTLNFTINGNLDIQDDTYFYAYRKSCKNTFTGPSISCAEGKIFYIQGPGSAANAAKGMIGWHTRLLGDMSNFRGTLQVGNRSAILGFALLCTDNFAGTVDVYGGDNVYPSTGVSYYGSGTLAPCSTNANGEVSEYVGETKIAKLNLQDNCNLVLGVNPGDESGCGRITVTERLTYGGRVNLFLATTHPAYSMEERRVTLITAPLGSNLAGVDFRPSYPNNRSEDVLCSFCVTTNETEGTESYCLVMPRYSTHNKSNEAYDKTCSVQASFQTYWYWDYATDNRTTFDSDTIYLSASDILDQCKDDAMNFGGKKFVLRGAKRVMVYSSAPPWRACDLYDTSYIDINSSVNFTANFAIGVYGTNNGIVNDSKTKNNDITLSPACVLKGDGAFGFRGTTNTVASILGDVSEFSGRFLVTRYKEEVVVNDGQYVTLKIADGAKLGTPVDTTTFVSNALTLTQYSRLQVTDTTAMAYPCRGLFVDGNAGVNVSADKVFTYAAPLSLTGRLVKEGAGVFALGGDLRVPVDANGAPVADKNVLEVTAGAIAATSTDAFNGASISFADGASICVDVASDDADLAEKGLVDTVAAEPFATDAADGKIAVTFRATGETGEDEKSVAVCTVPAGSAFADPAKYKLAGGRRVGDVRFNAFSAQDNGDGTTTVRADFLGKQGLLLILR